MSHDTETKKSFWSAILITLECPPKIERMRFRIVPDAIVRALELRKGSADVRNQFADAGHGRRRWRKERGLAVDEAAWHTARLHRIQF